jgi:hypothetical protein
VVLDDTLGRFLSANSVRTVLVSASHRYFPPKDLAFFTIDTTITYPIFNSTRDRQSL